MLKRAKADNIYPKIFFADGMCVYVFHNKIIQLRDDYYIVDVMSCWVCVLGITHITFSFFLSKGYMAVQIQK